MGKNTIYKIGVISDTHGLLRPEAANILQDSDMIIHAGDIDSPFILKQLKHIAPVVAVRGNMDKGEWAYALRTSEIVEKQNTLLYVIHNLESIDLDPHTANIKVVISGHSHKPSIEKHNGILYLNPGSAGPHRFSLPVSVARLHINGSSINAEIVTLKVETPW